MADKRNVTLRAQWLGKILKEMREKSGFTLKEAGDYLQRDSSQLSRFESGIYPIRRGDVYGLMDLYGVGDKSQRSMLLQLTDEVAQTGWWDKYSKELPGIIDYVWLENRAEEFWTFHTTPVHGLLQTPEYSEAWLRSVHRDSTDKQIERWVEMRMKRQEILAQEGPPRLNVLMDEAVIRRVVGGREVMKGQLRHLLDCIKHPNITIRVLPFTAGAHSSPDGGFVLIKMSDPFPVIAYADGPAGSLYIESDEAEALVAAHRHLTDLSLTEEETATMIGAVEKEL